jgi:hypothetical protein
MKKILTLMAIFLLTFGAMPVVFAEEAEIGGGIDVGVGGTCEAPEIFVDPTARIWNPNDQTFYTADEWGTVILSTEHPYAFAGYAGDSGYIVPERQNYVFTGETLTYYIAIYDEDGEADIVNANTQLLFDGIAVGACAPIADGAIATALVANVGIVNKEEADQYVNDHFSIPGDIAVDFGGAVAVDGTEDDTDYKFFACTLIGQAGWTDEVAISVQTTDGGDSACSATPNTVESLWSDLVNFNPTLGLTLTGGPIDFGAVEEGTTAVSSTVYVENTAEDGSGVMMDMYIAGDDYFTDPTPGSGALCPTGNGIHHSNFHYYATKGSLNSGDNDGVFDGLGVTDGTDDPWDAAVLELCDADVDEFTRVPSHSGDIGDMCRMINAGRGDSFLAQGADMSVTLKLDVPATCQGDFTSGDFHFVGRVI